jgi:PhoH-like ATPase
LAYARGTSIDNAIIIVDEVQNISKDNMHTLMTRIGENSKMILLGDTKQIDLRNKQESSLRSLISMFKNVDEIGVVEMDDSEGNVRNPIIDIIEKKFDELEDGKH